MQKLNEISFLFQAKTCAVYKKNALILKQEHAKIKLRDVTNTINNFQMRNKKS